MFNGIVTCCNYVQRSDFLVKYEFSWFDFKIGFVIQYNIIIKLVIVVNIECLNEANFKEKFYIRCP